MIATDVKVWVATTPVHMRKSFDALRAVVENFLQRDPHGGHLFVFRNRGGHLLKILWHDREGWTIYYCDSPGLSDSGGGRIMVSEGGPKDERNEARNVAAWSSIR